MNHARKLPIPSRVPSLAILAAFSALLGCSSERLALRLDPSFPRIDSSRRPAESGNGGPRGGGDRVAAEFMEYERIVVAKIDAWKKEGKISISDEEFAKIKALMPPNAQTNPKHVVTSEEHVCMTEGKLASGECLRREDERDVIKQPFATPPRIIVGRARWDEPSNTPALKEEIVQHELRGLALSKKGEVFADESFDQTYRYLATASKEWNALVRTHLDYLRRIRLYDEMIELVDLSHFATVKETFTLTSADYSRCVNASNAEVAEIDSVEKKLAKKINHRNKRDDLWGNLRRIQAATNDLNHTDVKQACDRALDQFQKALLEYGTPQIQAQMNQIRDKVQAVANDWQTWANSVSNQNWKYWLFRKMQTYIDRRNYAFAKFNSRQPSQYEIANTLNPIMDEHCPRSAMKDFRIAVKCNVDAGVPVANAFFKTFLGKNVDDLVAAHDASVDEVASQVDPI